MKNLFAVTLALGLLATPMFAQADLLPASFCGTRIGTAPITGTTMVTYEFRQLGNDASITITFLAPFTGTFVRNAILDAVNKSVRPLDNAAADAAVAVLSPLQVAKGMVISFQLVPGKGTVLSINGVAHALPEAVYVGLIPYIEKEITGGAGRVHGC